MGFLGHVHWFNNRKGYGFLRIDGLGADIFIHHSAILMSGYKRLEHGQRVEFEMGYTPRGLIATRLTPMSFELKARAGMTEPPG